MKIKHLNRALLIGSTVVIMWSCASTKKVASTTPTLSSSQLATTAVTHTRTQQDAIRGIQSKTNLTVNLGGSEVSIGGNIKMVRDEIIQMSLTMMGIMEVARIEMTPEYIMIQDRYNKQYVKAGWNEICLEGMGITFHTFQALFWSELFLPGSKTTPTSEDFEVTDNVLTPKVAPTCGTTVSFTLDATDGKIKTTSMGLTGAHTLDLAWNYLSWTTLENSIFPNQMQLTSGKDNQQMTVTLNLTKVEVNNNLSNIATDVNTERYTAITMDDILKKYLKIK